VPAGQGGRRGQHKTSKKTSKTPIKDNLLHSKKAEKDNLGQFRTIKDNEKMSGMTP
jgi:hypothetical protein